ncbi:cysteine-rich CWC family protein [Metasolibacillus fluoroglycofenilyticus]|uniref:cysteine-rich CWC family protein n=1 Tax=Metasolibacillus fluoroglycofenilyticus TaxID=1239396 RepID=UPI0009EEC34D|nr:cysteine-rich CWC family protein [Metasolibacillus fluoroglycofenilyticus]
MADEKECPLCGGSNNCGVASKQSDCWCMTVKFPKEILIENPTSCICEKCLEEYGRK